MAKKKTDAAAPEPVVETAAAAAPEPEQETPVAAPEPAQAPAGPITVFYRDHRGRGALREFSQEVHGDTFAALAAEFQTTNASKIITDPIEGKAAVEDAALLEAEERRQAEKARNGK